MPHGKFVGCDRPSIGFDRPSIGVRSPLPSPLPSVFDRLRSPLLLSPHTPLRWKAPSAAALGATPRASRSAERENRTAAPSLAKPLKTVSNEQSLTIEKIGAKNGCARDWHRAALEAEPTGDRWPGRARAVRRVEKFSTVAVHTAPSPEMSSAWFADFVGDLGASCAYPYLRPS
jgi:hypothetical protein